MRDYETVKRIADKYPSTRMWVVKHILDRCNGHEKAAELICELSAVGAPVNWLMEIADKFGEGLCMVYDTDRDTASSDPDDQRNKVIFETMSLFYVPDAWAFRATYVGDKFRLHGLPVTIPRMSWDFDRRIVADIVFDYDEDVRLIVPASDLRPIQ